MGKPIIISQPLCRRLRLAVFMAPFFGLAACSPSDGLTEVHCDAVAKHIVTLREAAGEGGAFAPQARTLRNVCMQSMSPGHAECILRADRYEEVKRCGGG